jgi:hypothetical protein
MLWQHSSSSSSSSEQIKQPKQKGKNHPHRLSTTAPNTINKMHAFTTPAALALLIYLSTAHAQVAANAIEHMQPSTPTTLSTAIIASVSPTPAAFDPTNYDPNDCTNPEPYLSMECMRSINVANNADIIPCDRASDCKCGERLGPSNTPFGYTETCSGSSSVPNSCMCVALTEEASDDITQGLIAFGEVTCMVVNEAAAMEAKLLKLTGKVSKMPEMKWAGRIYKVGLNVWARGSKMGSCKNVGCPEHQFVAIDPEDMEKDLGLLDVC